MRHTLKVTAMALIFMASTNSLADGGRGKHGQMKAAMQECIATGKSKDECRQEMRKNHKGDRGESCAMKEHSKEE